MDAVQFHCSFGESPLHWKQVKSPHTTSTFSLVDRELVLTVHFSAVYTFFPVSPSRLLSTPCHFCSLPILSKPPHPSTATFVSPAHPPPHSPSLPQPLPWCAALSLQHLSLIWNEEEMPPCGLTSGPSQGLPEIDACDPAVLIYSLHPQGSGRLHRALLERTKSRQTKWSRGSDSKIVS